MDPRHHRLVARPPIACERVNNDNSQFLPASAPSSEAANLLTPLLGSSSTATQIVVVASRDSGPLTTADLAAVAREIATVRKVNRVTSAQALGESPDRHAVQIVLAHSKPLSELFGSQPVLVIRRCAVALPFEELLQIRGLLLCLLENEFEPGEVLSRFKRSAIINERGFRPDTAW